MPRQRASRPSPLPTSTSASTTELRLIDIPDNLEILLSHLRTAFTVLAVSEPRWSRVPGMQRIYVTVEIPALSINQ